MNALTIGIFFALLAAFSSGVEKIFRRHVAVRVDAVTFSFLFSTVAALVLLPIYLTHFQLPSQTKAWIFLLAPSILFAGTSFFIAKAYSHLETSIAAPISRIKILIVLALSVLFIHETFNITKLLGTLTIFLGLLLLSYKKGGRAVDLKNPGLYFLVASVTCTAVASVIQKQGLAYITTQTYAFFVYFIPALLFFPFFLAKKIPFGKIYNNGFWPLSLMAILSVGYQYSTLLAFKFTEASIVIPFTELSSFIAVLGGILFLKERDHITKKLASTFVTILGAVLVALS